MQPGALSECVGADNVTRELLESKDPVKILQSITGVKTREVDGQIVQEMEDDVRNQNGPNEQHVEKSSDRSSSRALLARIEEPLQGETAAREAMRAEILSEIVTVSIISGHNTA